MRLLIEDRVWRSLRHIQPQAAKKVKQIIKQLEAMIGQIELDNIADISHQLSLQKLSTPGEQVFILRATPDLRILLKYSKDQTLIIEDIVSHELLEKHFVGSQR